MSLFSFDPTVGRESMTESRASRTRKSTPAMVVVAGLVALFTISSAMPFSGGAPASRTGGPGDAGTCNDVGCHNTFALNSGTGSVAISGPSTYLPGQPLDLSVRVMRPGATRIGFQISVRNAAGNHVGTFVLTDTNSEFASGDPNYVTHDQAPFVADENSWTVRWIPPAVFTETVTFYAAGNTANGNGSPTGDRIYTTTFSVSRGTATSTEADELPDRFEVTDVFPNPFVRQTTIAFRQTNPGDVSLVLFDASGREVRNESLGTRETGEHTYRLTAGSLPGGVYYYRLNSGQEVRSGSILLVR